MIPRVRGIMVAMVASPVVAKPQQSADLKPREEGHHDGHRDQ